MGTTSHRFICQLTEKFRVLEIGGLAIIAHGLSRKTKDADIWLDPMADARIWSRSLEEECRKFGGLAMSHLREFAAAGDPFSLAILEGREIL